MYPESDTGWLLKGQKVIMDKNKEFNFDEIQRALEEKVEVQETEAPGESEVSEKKQGAEKEWKNEESKETAKEWKNEESQRREKKWEDEESRETPKEEREEFRKTEDVDEERESKTSEEDGNFQRTEDTGESWNGREREEREAFLKSEEAAVTFQKGMSTGKEVQIRQWKLALSQGTRAAVARVGGAGKQLWRWRKKKWVRLTGIGLVILIVLFSVRRL